jgi:2,3-bisphosphoglycerate-dependent phosphoglycerate mutase
MQLFFIRHAQSENNALWTDTGSSVGRLIDPEVTKLGLQQAVRLAQKLKSTHSAAPFLDEDPSDATGFQITHLYSSLLMRALTTANIVAEAIDQPILGLVDIFEGGGIWHEDEESGEYVGLPGKRQEELLAAFPRLILTEKIDPNGWWSRPFEPIEERIPRAKRVLEWLLDQHGGQDHKVVFISHAAFYNYFLCSLLGSTQRLPAWFELNNCGITKIDFQNSEVRLVYCNRIDHLSPELIT